MTFMKKNYNGLQEVTHRYTVQLASNDQVLTITFGGYPPPKAAEEVWIRFLNIGYATEAVYATYGSLSGGYLYKSMMFSGTSFTSATSTQSIALVVHRLIGSR